MKLLPCLLWVATLVAIALLAGCTTDAHGRQQFDPIKAGRILDTGALLLDLYNHPPQAKADEIPPLWRETLYHEGRVIPSQIPRTLAVIDGEAVDL